MLCPSCSSYNSDNVNFCNNCGHEIKKHHNLPSDRVVRKPLVRVFMTLYVLAWLFLLLIGFAFFWSQNQTKTTIDQQASYIACTNGNKYSYYQLSIYNPATDYNGDAYAIDNACGNNGGNSYFNISKTYKDSNNPIRDAIYLVGAGAIIIEIIKSALMFITQGYVPALYSFSKPSKRHK